MGNTHTARRHRHSESDSDSNSKHMHTAKKHHRRARHMRSHRMRSHHSRRHRIRKQHGGFNWMFWKKDEAPAVDGAPAAQPLSVDMVEKKLQNFTKESKEGVAQGFEDATATAKQKGTDFLGLFQAKTPAAEVAPAAAPAQGGGRRRKGRKTIRKRKRSGHKH